MENYKVIAKRGNVNVRFFDGPCVKVIAEYVNWNNGYDTVECSSTFNCIEVLVPMCKSIDALEISVSEKYCVDIASGSVDRTIIDKLVIKAVDGAVSIDGNTFFNTIKVETVYGGMDASLFAKNDFNISFLSKYGNFSSDIDNYYKVKHSLSGCSVVNKMPITYRIGATALVGLSVATGGRVVCL